MHWTGILVYIVALCWLLPGAMVDIFVKKMAGPTATVVLIAWGYGEVCAWMTGNAFPTSFYYISDAISIALIWSWRTGRDDWILWLYIPEWLEYQNPDQVAGWFACTALTLAQMIIAGPWSAFGKNRTREARRGVVKGAYS